MRRQGLRVWLKDTPRGDWEFADSLDAVDEVDEFLALSALLRVGLRQRGTKTSLCLPSIYPCSARCAPWAMLG